MPPVRRACALEGLREARNGILLRADLHRLFDLGSVTVTPERRLEVSGRLRADYSNGHSYYSLARRELRTPQLERDRPATEFLCWHNEHVYRG